MVRNISNLPFCHVAQLLIGLQTKNLPEISPKSVENRQNRKLVAKKVPNPKLYGKKRLVYVKKCLFNGEKCILHAIFPTLYAVKQTLHAANPTL